MRVHKYPDPSEVLFLIGNYQPSISDDNFTPHVACPLGDRLFCQGKHPLDLSSISYYKLISWHRGVFSNISISSCKLGKRESVTER